LHYDYTNLKKLLEDIEKENRSSNGIKNLGDKYKKLLAFYNVKGKSNKKMLSALSDLDSNIPKKEVDSSFIPRTKSGVEAAYAFYFSIAFSSGKETLTGVEYSIEDVAKRIDSCLKDNGLKNSGELSRSGNSLIIDNGSSSVTVNISKENTSISSVDRNFTSKLEISGSLSVKASKLADNARSISSSIASTKESLESDGKSAPYGKLFIGLAENIAKYFDRLSWTLKGGDKSYGYLLLSCLSLEDLKYWAKILESPETILLIISIKDAAKHIAYIESLLSKPLRPKEEGETPYGEFESSCMTDLEEYSKEVASFNREISDLCGNIIPTIENYLDSYLRPNVYKTASIVLSNFKSRPEKGVDYDKRGQNSETSYKHGEDIGLPSEQNSSTLETEYDPETGSAKPMNIADEKETKESWNGYPTTDSDKSMLLTKFSSVIVAADFIYYLCKSLTDKNLLEDRSSEEAIWNKVPSFKKLSHEAIEIANNYSI